MTPALGKDPLLRAQDLVMERGGARVLDIPSLDVFPGEVLGLLGPNGAGKSSLLLALAGLWPPALGWFSFRGRRVGEEVPLSVYRRRIAMVFQEALLLDTTVFRNVALGLRMRGVEKGETEERVAENLERLRIPHLRERSARSLSGGESQRVSLARALAVRPEVLFLDEPFAALDAPTREALLEDLEVTLPRTGTTVLFATHDRGEALRLSDRLAVLKEGRVVQEGAPAEVMNRPADGFVASFLGIETVIEGRVLAGGQGLMTVEPFGPGGGKTEIEAVGTGEKGETVLLCIRPETVTLSRPGKTGGATSARNAFPGRVERVTVLGPYRKVTLDCGFPLASFVTEASLAELGIGPGVEVVASVKATAIQMIRRH